jgi:ribosomal protein S21
MANFTPRDRSGKPIRNYRPRKDFDLPGQPYGVRVPGTSHDDLEKSLKIFKRTLKASGRLWEIKEKRHFEKDSLKNRKAKLSAIRTQQWEEIQRKRNEKRHECWTAIVNGQAM